MVQAQLECGSDKPEINAVLSYVRTSCFFPIGRHDVQVTLPTKPVFYNYQLCLWIYDYPSHQNHESYPLVPRRVVCYARATEFYYSARSVHTVAFIPGSTDLEFRKRAPIPSIGSFHPKIDTAFK